MMNKVVADIDMSAYRLAEEFALQTSRCMFITGKAGTGKTTFLKNLREHTAKNMAVVAPTGVAAINAGGMTIHSFFQLPIRTLVPTPQSYTQLIAEQRLPQRKRNMLYHLELLVIDEISMVRSDVLDAIDVVLRHYRYRPDTPFGGVQVVMIGDLFQLSPVVTQGDDRMMMQKYYEGPYFFQSKVMQELHPVYIEFDHVFRQQNVAFVDVLNEVRENRLSAQSRAMLNSRYIPEFQNKENDFHITLTTHNQTADQLNEQELDRLKGRSSVFKAVVFNDFPENNFPTDESLTLKIGARVMFIRNDDQQPRRFYNGKLGIVTDIGSDTVTVECEDGEIEVKRMEWENIRYTEDEETGKITEETLGTFTQFPLRLAWAITIHKSQGLTFDRVIIDAARAFAAGQVYVALSRCRTLEGIVLSTPIGHVALANDISVISFTKQQTAMENLAQVLPQAEMEYKLQLFTDLFDFRRLESLVKQMTKLVEQQVSFSPSTKFFLKEMETRIDALLPVADKFKPQLTRIVLSSDIQYLKQRISAATDYFSPFLSQMASLLANHPCRSKNKTDAADFFTLLSDLFLVVHQKMFLMKAVSGEPTTESFLNARNRFVAPMQDLPSVKEKPARKSTRKTKPTDSELTTLSDEQLDSMISDFLSDGSLHPAFLDLINKVKKKKSPSAQYANRKWTVEDELRLKHLYLSGASVAQLMKDFGRSRKAIEERLRKLSLLD